MPEMLMMKDVHLKVNFVLELLILSEHRMFSVDYIRFPVVQHVSPLYEDDLKDGISFEVRYSIQLPSDTIVK